MHGIHDMKYSKSKYLPIQVFKLKGQMKFLLLIKAFKMHHSNPYETFDIDEDIITCHMSSFTSGRNEVLTNFKCREDLIFATV